MLLYQKKPLVMMVLIILSNFIIAHGEITHPLEPHVIKLREYLQFLNDDHKQENNDGLYNVDQPGKEIVVQEEIEKPILYLAAEGMDPEMPMVGLTQDQEIKCTLWLEEQFQKEYSSPLMMLSGERKPWEKSKLENVDQRRDIDGRNRDLTDQNQNNSSIKKRGNFPFIQEKKQEQQKNVPVLSKNEKNEKNALSQIQATFTNKAKTIFFRGLEKLGAITFADPGFPNSEKIQLERKRNES